MSVINLDHLVWERVPDGIQAQWGNIAIRVGRQLDNGMMPFFVHRIGDQNQTRGEAYNIQNAKVAAVEIANKIVGQFYYLRGLGGVPGHEHVSTLSRGLSATLATMGLKHLDSKVTIETLSDGYAFKPVHNPTLEQIYIIQGVLLGLYFGLTGISK